VVGQTVLDSVGTGAGRAAAGDGPAAGVVGVGVQVAGGEGSRGWDRGRDCGTAEGSLRSQC